MGKSYSKEPEGTPKETLVRNQIDQSKKVEFGLLNVDNHDQHLNDEGIKWTDTLEIIILLLVTLIILYHLRKVWKKRTQKRKAKETMLTKILTSPTEQKPSSVQILPQARFPLFPPTMSPMTTPSVLAIACLAPTTPSPTNTTTTTTTSTVDTSAQTQFNAWLT